MRQPLPHAYSNRWRLFEVGKKLTGRALADFKATRDIWQEVLDSAREIKAGGGKSAKVAEHE